MESLSRHNPKLLSSESILVAPKSDTPHERLNHFYNLLNSSDTARFRTICLYQKKWIAEAIQYDGAGSERAFMAFCKTNDGVRFKFQFELRQVGTEMQIFEKKNPHVQAGFDDEELCLGTVSNLTFDDFDVVYPRIFNRPDCPAVI